MKRFTLAGLVIVMLVAVTVASEPVKVFPDLWDQDAIKLAPTGPGYPVLAITELIDGDTFEALLHVAPQLVTSVHIRVAFPDGRYVDMPDKKCPGGFQQARDAVLTLLVNADSIRITFLEWDIYCRWKCAVTINGKIDLAAWIQDNKLTKADLCPDSKDPID